VNAECCFCCGVADVRGDRGLSTSELLRYVNKRRRTPPLKSSGLVHKSDVRVNRLGKPSGGLRPHFTVEPADCLVHPVVNASVGADSGRACPSVPAVLLGVGSPVEVVGEISALTDAADVGVKVPSTAASPVKPTRATTSREQALRQLIAAAERLVEQGERAFFEIAVGRLTTEVGSARPTMYAPDHASGSSTCSQRFLARHFPCHLEGSGDLTARGGQRQGGLGELAAKQYPPPQAPQAIADTHVAKVMIDRSYG
jgi:hypothetical protein